MGEKSPTVSVIIPTYNRAHLVGWAIQSVLDQTYQDFEIIVVDDGSNDNTKGVVKSFKDSRVCYVRHEQNEGGAAARNTGIKVAQGKYIAFQDSDDEWLPEKLEKQMKVFVNAPAKVGVVYTGFWRIEGYRKTYIPSAKINQKDGDIHNELLKGNFVNTPTAVVRKECFKKIGMFDERLPRRQDWDLFIRISKTYYFICIDEPLVNANFTADSISTNQHALLKALTLILEKHYEEFKKDRRILAKHQYSIGSISCQSEKMDQGRHFLFQALKSHPFSGKHIAAAFASLFGRASYAKVIKLKRQIRSVKRIYKRDS